MKQHDSAVQQSQLSTRTERTLTDARLVAASSLDVAIKRLITTRGPAFSNTAIAKRVGVDEKIVRQWRTGEKPMPVGALCMFSETLQKALLVEMRLVEPAPVTSFDKLRFRTEALHARADRAIANARKVVAESKARRAR